MRSIPDNAAVATTLAYAARTVTASGTGVDTGRDNYQAAAVITAGAWTDGTHTFTFEESPDNSTWTALGAAKLDDPAGLLATAAIVIDGATDDDVIIEIGLLNTERYVRVVQTVSGGPSTGLISGAQILSWAPRHAGGSGQPMSATGYTRTDPTI